ncbi:uncharacterized protein TRAVEDRAFT_56940 [Trametes versicolor FP-101664 SS1]|uniref:uncharacterized protein n=1 Tax=Trametes versicolor (strain FP-101664) TaxID=717944 RepID=UPI00046245C4|nr:uncharacterized protein TRAVEDRAFT_56940 [Trametes versicolor FP-101664 SS1]EIW61695.1 hypothetical protein TRAVEDRAFT_56940 [Trametes versicolor FP-101664 SS1]
MSDAESVTISLLPVSLSLVHLPRSRLEHFTQHVLRQILQPTPVFLNVTCNEVEVSLFAEYDTLQEFHKAARKDARRVRQRDRESRTDANSSPRRAKRTKEDWEPVEVTSERWKVLQIDSHSDCLDNSGARVHELSAPLAAAGISILYQSSYMSDFIFVKEERLAEVMSLLGSAGFDLYLSDPSNLTAQISTFASPLISPTGEDEPPIGMIDLNTFQGTGRSDSGIIFTRSRSNTSGTTSSSSSRSQELLHRTSTPPDDPRSPLTPEDTPRADPTGAPPARPARSRTLSHSPSACDVRVLSPDITCVGLSDDSADTWSLKIIKLVAFPELIVGSVDVSRRASERRARSAHPQSPSMLPALPEEQFRVLSLSEGEVGSGSDTTTRVAPESPKKDPLGDDLLPEDERDETHDTFDDDDSSDDEDGTRRRRPRLPHLDTLRTVHAPSKSVTPSPRSRSTSSSSSESAPPPLVPFFSFTRTPEGSSLAAPVSLLATLFPASERHMVMCSQELDVLDSRNASPERWEEDEEGSVDDDADGALPEPDGTLKCLQIDLRKFGLEKHGLVNRFSRTLEDNGINHMYSSTYKTANLLVDKAHASRAQALLRSC